MDWNVFDHLLRGILRGYFGPGEFLPSEHEITRKFGVSRLSVRSAMQTLEHLGYLESRRGVGRKVRARQDPIVLSLAGEESFSDKMSQGGFDIQTKVLTARRVIVRPKIRNRLGLTGTEAFKLSRLRTRGKQPVALHISYLDSDRFPELEKIGKNMTSLFAYFREKGITQLDKKKSRLTTTFPTRREYDVLSCPNLVPLVMIESETWDKTAQSILQYTKILYRSDLFHFQF